MEVLVAPNYRYTICGRGKINYIDFYGNFLCENGKIILKSKFRLNSIVLIAKIGFVLYFYGLMCIGYLISRDFKILFIGIIVFLLYSTFNLFLYLMIKYDYNVIKKSIKWLEEYSQPNSN